MIEQSDGTVETCTARRLDSCSGNELLHLTTVCREKRLACGEYASGPGHNEIVPLGYPIGRCRG
jgi:hypothetical protein